MAKYFTFVVPSPNGDTTQKILFMDGDNRMWTLGEGEQDPNYLAWVAEGNTAEEWNPEEQ